MEDSDTVGGGERRPGDVGARRGVRPAQRGDVAGVGQAGDTRERPEGSVENTQPQYAL